MSECAYHREWDARADAVSEGTVAGPDMICACYDRKSDRRTMDLKARVVTQTCPKLSLQRWVTLVSHFGYSIFFSTLLRVSETQYRLSWVLNIFAYMAP